MERAFTRHTEKYLDRVMRKCHRAFPISQLWDCEIPESVVMEVRMI